MNTPPNFDAIAISIAQSRGELPLNIVRRVQQAFIDLPQREQTILRQRFDRAEATAVTLGQIADNTPGLRAERARQIESRALSSLREAVYG